MGTCENCFFWERVSRSFGRCHRLPPSPYAIPRDGPDDNPKGDPVISWPKTEANDWCGEWQQKG